MPSHVFCRMWKILLCPSMYSYVIGSHFCSILLILTVQLITNTSEQYLLQSFSFKIYFLWHYYVISHPDICRHLTLSFRHLCSTDSRFAPSQWETALLCNDVSHWLGASLESALFMSGRDPNCGSCKVMDFLVIYCQMSWILNRLINQCFWVHSS